MAALVKFLWLMAALLAVKVFLDPLIAGLTSHKHGFVGYIENIVATPLRALSQTIKNSVESKSSVEAGHTLRPVNRWIRSYANREATVVAAIAASAAATADALERGFGIALPREIGKATKPIDRRARKAAKAAAAAAALGLALRHGLRHVTTKTIPHAANQAVHRATAIAAGEIAHEGIRSRARDRALGERIDRLSRRVAKWLGGAVLVGAIVKVLARRFPWLFCRRVRDTGKRLCSMNLDLWSYLLDGATLAFASLSLETFAREALAATDWLVTSAIHWMIWPLTASGRVSFDPVDYLGSAGKSAEGLVPIVPLGDGDYLG
jgi:hypothetical protein